jgi:glucokinase
LSHIIGIDVGGTKIAAGIVKFPDGRLMSHRVIPSDTLRGNKVLDEINSLARTLANDSKVKVSGLGLGICELVSANGAIQSAATFKWTSRQIRTNLAQFAPITIEADVRAAALAEAMFGGGRKYRSFLFVTVGTGVSCSLVVDGKPYTGKRGATGTMASAALTLRCEQCGHVQHRSVEEVSSGPGLVARFVRAGGTAAQAQDVFRSSTYAAMEVLEEGGEALGNTVATLVDVLDPEAVIVGGSIGLAKGIYWKSLVRSTRRHIWSEVSRGIPIRRAETGQQAGIIGAAAAAWRASLD